MSNWQQAMHLRAAAAALSWSAMIEVDPTTAASLDIAGGNEEPPTSPEAAPDPIVVAPAPSRKARRAQAAEARHQSWRIVKQALPAGPRAIRRQMFRTVIGSL